ncbi:MOSC domain-containing protein [Acidobacteria bacterium AB60]|nr:MOSC domain-containing protein [Acidobacteria bacterium AB60]
MNGIVVSVSADATHRFCKPVTASIWLLEGLGVKGDAHFGVTVQHRSRVAKDPTQPNLRQVHLIQSELFEELALAGFEVHPGQMGENVTTRGIDLLSLPAGAHLELGDAAAIAITGLRNPCFQIDHFQNGLMKAVLDRDEDGALIRKAGVMGIVLKSGEVRPGDAIRVTFPPQPHQPLQVV